MGNLRPKVRMDAKTNSFFSAGNSNQIRGPYLKRPLLITGDDENTGSKGKKSDRTFKIINIKIKVDE